MILLKRVLRAGFLNFKRNRLISWSAVLIVTMTLSVIASLVFLQAVLGHSLDEIKNKVDVTIYFNTGADEESIFALQKSIESLPEVASVEYTSSEEALRLFRERHSDDYPTIQALDEIGENPLGAYLNIKAKEVSQYENISNFLKSDDKLVLGSASIIDKINYHQNKLVIDRLNSIISGAQKLGLLVTLMLAALSVMITLNTIRLTIFISKEEIAVMRLVGASKMRVRGPFMIEGAIYGIIATFITIIIFWPATAWFSYHMSDFLGFNLYEYYISNFFKVFGIVLLSGVLLGTISSFLAVRRYLNR